MKILKAFLIPIVLFFAFTNLNAQTKVACNPAACAKTSKTAATTTSDNLLVQLVNFATAKANCTPADCAKICAGIPNCNPADCKQSTAATATASIDPIATLVSTKVVSAREYVSDIVASTEGAKKKNCTPAECAKKCKRKTSL